MNDRRDGLQACGPFGLKWLCSGTIADAHGLARWQKTIVYECYPKSFQDTGASGIGTLRGIIERLDHLASLGVGAIWLTPWTEREVTYDPAFIDGLKPSAGSLGKAVAGTLRSLEATVWSSE